MNQLARHITKYLPSRPASLDPAAHQEHDVTRIRHVVDVRCDLEDHRNIRRLTYQQLSRSEGFLHNAINPGDAIPFAIRD